MTQPSIYETLGLAACKAPPHCSKGLEIYDFFAGGGGFGEGARQAGCSVAWACDACPVALAAHAANHPGCIRLQATLPLPRAQLPFPTDGRPFHAHFSPPCTQFSKINSRGRSDDARRQAASLVRWSLKTALASGATSWSLEQVYTFRVIALLEAVRKRHPTRVAYARFDFSEFGVPQTRTRLLAGSPELIARLMRLRTRSNRRSVRNTIAKPRGTHVRNSRGWIEKRYSFDGRAVYTKAAWSDGCHPTSDPSPTVLSGRELSWVSPSEAGCPHAQLSTPEIAALQTFPPHYRWPPSAKRATRLIGNAFPPLVARLLMGGK